MDLVLIREQADRIAHFLPGFLSHSVRPLRQFVEPQLRCSSRDQSPKLPQGGIGERVGFPAPVSASMIVITALRLGISWVSYLTDRQAVDVEPKANVPSHGLRLQRLGVFQNPHHL